ncbi:MAG: rod shape-determining protein MreD [Oscillospiraceae bacterium]|jgi:rod shape-determining protein MreD|nr:rod shape-determining protein MreD [Oscillospiraceae bacterium]
MEKRYNALRYFAYSLEILLFFIIMGIPNFMPEIFGGKPTFLLPIALTIALFEREPTAMIFGGICGALTDFGYSNSLGFFAIAMAVVCFFVSYIAHNRLVVNILNAAVATLIIIAIVFVLHFFVFHAAKGYGGYQTYFAAHYMSRILYSWVFVFLFFYLNRGFSSYIQASDF